MPVAQESCQQMLVVATAVAPVVATVAALVAPVVATVAALAVATVVERNLEVVRLGQRRLPALRTLGKT